MLDSVIATERLTLRPFAFEDLSDVVAYATDEEWGRFLPLPSTYTEADARRFLAVQLLLDWREHPSWAIVHEGRVVGGINMRFSAAFRIGEIGYSVARPLWGRGLVSEATRTVVDAAFERIRELDRVRAMADVRNCGSLRVLEKTGFRREGVLRANRYVRDVAVDEVWCGLLRSEWEASRTADDGSAP